VLVGHSYGGSVITEAGADPKVSALVYVAALQPDAGEASGQLMSKFAAPNDADAMGCQRDIAQKIIDKKADYLLALKGNQGRLRDDVELFAREQKAVVFKNTSVSQDTTVDGDHGRTETRTIIGGRLWER
jgi:pimeloyl-ACP methyl ester carboxylesterase